MNSYPEICLTVPDLKEHTQTQEVFFLRESVWKGVGKLFDLLARIVLKLNRGGGVGSGVDRQSVRLN